MGRDGSLAAVLFDLDGVVVDSRLPIARSINAALAGLGLAPQPEASLHRFIGPPLHGVFELLLREQGADPSRADEGVALYRARYASASLEETTLVPGIAQALADAAARWPLAVATSKPTAFAAPIVERLGVAGFFRAIVGPDLGPRGEPKRETVGRALAALGVGAGEAHTVAMVGDRHHDVEAARAHGCVAVGVTWGIGFEMELRECGADLLVVAPGRLVEALRTALGAAGRPA
jgi:phosphoglycolate phosphatase